MTEKQAKDIVCQLLVGYRKEDGDYSPDFLRVFVQRIARFDYSVASRAVNECLDTNRFFPNISEFVEACEKSGHESYHGTANAGAYSRRGPGGWAELDITRKARREHGPDFLARMSERDYQDLLQAMGAKHAAH